jgi:hypothetical protein
MPQERQVGPGIHQNRVQEMAQVIRPAQHFFRISKKILRRNVDDPGGSPMNDENHLHRGSQEALPGSGPRRQRSGNYRVRECDEQKTNVRDFFVFLKKTGT